MAYGIFESTSINGRNMSFVSDIDIENGWLVHKGDLVNNGTDIYEAVIPTAATKGTDPVFVVGNPAWRYDRSNIMYQNEDMFINEAGKPFRVYTLQVNDIFTVGSIGIDGQAVRGQFVGLQAGSGKMEVSAAEPAGSAFVGKIIGVYELLDPLSGQPLTDGSKEKVMILIVKNG